MDDETLQPAALGDLRRESLVAVTILDKDHRPLAAGLATPESAAARRVFWPTESTKPLDLSNRAAFVRHSDKRTVAIFHFHLCPSPYPPRHYDYWLSKPL